MACIKILDAFTVVKLLTHASKIFKHIKCLKSEHVSCVYKVCKYILDNLKRWKKEF